MVLQDSDLYSIQFKFQSTVSIISILAEQAFSSTIPKKANHLPSQAFEIDYFRRVQESLNEFNVDGLDSFKNLVYDARLDTFNNLVYDNTCKNLVYDAIQSFSNRIFKHSIGLLFNLQPHGVDDRQTRLKGYVITDIVNLQSNLSRYLNYMEKKEARIDEEFIIRQDTFIEIKSSGPEIQICQVKVPLIPIAPIPPPQPPILSGRVAPLTLSTIYRKPNSNLHLPIKGSQTNLGLDLRNGKKGLKMHPSGRSLSGGPKFKVSEPQIVTANDFFFQALKHRFHNNNNNNTYNPSNQIEYQN